jgi:hypothetical protein
VTFTSNGDVGSAGNVYVGLSPGATLNFNSSAWFGNWNQRSTVVQGTGQVNVAGTLYNNGRFVASGGSLQVNYGSVGQSTDGSMGDATQAGWYAANGGQLSLPALAVSGTAAVNWGAAAGNGLNVNSLVNSLQISPLTGSNLRGTLGISLLAPDNPAVRPGLTDPVGIWSVSPAGGLSIDSASLSFRYDALAAATEGGEGNLKLYENSGNGWRLLAGWPTDIGNHLISGTCPA